MKENIYTIPINDAFAADCECPICEFMSKEEKNKIEYSLGASMMEPDERIVSNRLGYCQRHTQMMYDFGNKLSHALVLETRLKYIKEEIAKYSKQLKKPKKILFSSNQSADELSLSKTCVVCERLHKIEKDFVANFFYLYKKEPEFREKFFASKGFCLPHFEYLANLTYSHLNSDVGYEFLQKLCKLQSDNLVRVTEDVEWFTKKFDYRYKDEDWKNSKDAVIRGSLKISGFIEEK